MSFKLSPDVDKNKIFLVNFSELEGRLDPLSYSMKNVFLKSTFPLQKLVSHFFINPNQKKKTKENKTYPFIPMENISYTNANIKRVDTIQGSNSKNYTAFCKGDFLFSKITPCMENGKMAIVKDLPFLMGFGSSEFHVFREKTGLMSVDFLRSLFLIDNFRIYAKSNFTGTAGHQRVPPEFFYYLKIPIPPKEEQDKIVAKMDEAYSNKQKKEAEAQQLLDSIDHYLFGELGIDLPKKEENTLQSRIFTRQLSEVSGGRFDPFFHLLNQQDKLGKYKFSKLKKIANIKKGNSITSDSITNGNIPVIAGGQTSPYSHNIANSEGNVITVSASGAYSGYIWYHKNPIFASDCTIISSNLQYNLQIKYLFEYLKSQQQYIYNLQQGSGQPHVYPADLEKIKIPLPPLEKQTEIANHITEIRNQAKLLQQEAKAGLKQAKKEVEAIILGE